MPLATSLAEAVAAARRFNRFYTKKIGVLDESLVGSGFSLTEGRVLFELNQRAGASAFEIADTLGLDRGYLSRILQSFHRRKLVSRASDAADRRRSLLSLTSRGREAFANLNRRSAEEIEQMIAPLPLAKCEALLAAMASMERCLEPSDAAAPITFRPHRTGDLGWIAHRQGLLYAQEFGWDETYEALAAKILADFVLKFDATRERCWVAEQDRAILGGVFLVKEDDRTARLRLLYVEPEARGTGLGRRLVSECTKFAREVGYSRIVLWTQSILSGARRIYLTEGYRLVKSEPHTSFGHDLTGETWELDLRGAVAKA